MRREYEEPFNKSPVVRALTAFFLVVALLATITRITTRLISVGRLKKDDILVTAATVSDICPRYGPARVSLTTGPNILIGYMFD